MRHAYIAAGGLLLLAACATPREQCEARVDTNIAALKAAIAESEGNLERGYALREEVRPRFSYRFCSNGVNIETCLRKEYVTKKVPEAIDLEEERRKLASAKKRLAQDERKRAAALAQCAVQFPAEV